MRIFSLRFFMAVAAVLPLQAFAGPTDPATLVWTIRNQDKLGDLITVVGRDDSFSFQRCRPAQFSTTENSDPVFCTKLGLRDYQREEMVSTRNLLFSHAAGKSTTLAAFTIVDLLLVRAVLLEELGKFSLAAALKVSDGVVGLGALLSFGTTFGLLETGVDPRSPVFQGLALNRILTASGSIVTELPAEDFADFANELEQALILTDYDEQASVQLIEIYKVFATKFKDALLAQQQLSREMSAKAKVRAAEQERREKEAAAEREKKRQELIDRFFGLFEDNK